MNKHRLLESFAAGDTDVIRVVYDAYSRSVFSLAFPALGDRGLVEEAMQDTFVKAWKAAGRYDAERPLGLWIYSIARRVAAAAAIVARAPLPCTGPAY